MKHKPKSAPRRSSGVAGLFDLKANKSLGQNFLKDTGVLESIARATQELAGLGQRTLEIGPGTGCLTKVLLEQGHPVLAVELDPRSVEGLKLANQPLLEVVEGSILKLGSEFWQSLPAPLFGGKWVCVGNLPYYITSDILLWFLSKRDFFCGGIFMVQKEVGQRLTAQAGTKSYGRITARLALDFQVEWVCHVPAEAFEPKPQVDSAVICLKPHPQSALFPNEVEDFERFTSQLFSARRKMLRVTLKEFLLTSSPLESKIVIENLETHCQLKLTQRPEELDPLCLLTLFRYLRDSKIAKS